MAVHARSSSGVTPSHEQGLPPAPRIAFLIAAAAWIVVPAVGTVLVDTSGPGHHLALGHFVILLPTAVLAAMSVLLAIIARPGEMRRRPRRWIYLALFGLTELGLLGAVILVISTLGGLGITAGEGSIAQGLAAGAAYIGLLAYLVGFIGTIITRYMRSEHD